VRSPQRRIGDDPIPSSFFFEILFVVINARVLHQFGKVADSVAPLRMAYEVNGVLVAPLPLVKLSQISICDCWLIILCPVILLQCRIMLSVVNFDCDFGIIVIRSNESAQTSAEAHTNYPNTHFFCVNCAYTSHARSQLFDMPPIRTTMTGNPSSCKSCAIFVNPP
jgi:hypothetical protein